VADDPSGADFVDRATLKPDEVAIGPWTMWNTGELGARIINDSLLGYEREIVVIFDNDPTVLAPRYHIVSVASRPSMSDDAGGKWHPGGFRRNLECYGGNDIGYGWEDSVDSL
jgi:hypothetical protein